jgi:hypothetical protein
MSFYQQTDLTSIDVTAHLFANVEFCIMNGDDTITKAQMETWVHSNGGSLVQYPTVETNYIIAAKKSLKVQNIVAEATYNVIHAKWLRDCVHFNSIVPLQPKYEEFFVTISDI